MEWCQEIDKRLEVFSDVVFYEPMSENEILDIEKRIGQTIKPLFRQFLLVFGMTQDIFDDLKTNLEIFYDNFDFIKDSLKGYLPIFHHEDDEDEMYLLNNEDLLDDFIYKVSVDRNDNIGKVKKEKTFHQIIEEALSNLKKTIVIDAVIVTRLIIRNLVSPVKISLLSWKNLNPKG